LSLNQRQPPKELESLYQEVTGEPFSQPSMRRFYLLKRQLNRQRERIPDLLTELYEANWNFNNKHKKLTCSKLKLIGTTFSNWINQDLGIIRPRATCVMQDLHKRNHYKVYFGVSATLLKGEKRTFVVQQRFKTLTQQSPALAKLLETYRVTCPLGN